ncbi:MAG: hypothetical protein HC836_45630 [Richelia sp. RM2_1_2]|nr:hypothetical protein [Richelia sp. RM2_1_2]
MIKLNLGVNKDVSNEEYHADREYISSSGIKKLYWDELAYEKEYILGEKEDKAPSNALQEGTAIHTKILEPHLYDQQIVVYQEFDKRGNAYKAFELQNPGKLVISLSQQMRLDGMFKAYQDRPEAVELINSSEKEFTICKEINGIKCKVRADAINIDKGMIIDIKSTGYSAELETFKANAYSKLLSYDISAALYSMVAEAEYGKPFDFYYVVISKSEYKCEIYKASEVAQINGRNKIFKALEKLAYYRANGKWPENGKKAPEKGAYIIRDL